METTNYNELIKITRKAKGLTQQELADEAGVSLRTVQRIEKGTEEISGFSLRQISKILDIPLEQIIMQNVNQISIDSNQIGSIKALYLSSLTFFINPLFGIIVPGIIGFSKQNKSEFYKIHLKKLMLIQGIPLLLFGFALLSFMLTIIFNIPIPDIINLTGFGIFIIPLAYYSIVLALIIYNFFKLNKESIS